MVKNGIILLQKIVCIRGITSNHVGYFCCLNCLHSYRTKDKLKKHGNVCKRRMLKENNKILRYNHGDKSMKVPFIIYVDLESLLEKMNTCHNNPKKSSATKINKHTASGCSLFTHCSLTQQKINSIIIEAKIV